MSRVASANGLPALNAVCVSILPSSRRWSARFSAASPPLRIASSYIFTRSVRKASFAHEVKLRVDVPHGRTDAHHRPAVAAMPLSEMSPSAAYSAN